jgi:hypothetical protein
MFVSPLASVLGGEGGAFRETSTQPSLRSIGSKKKKRLNRLRLPQC